MSMNAFLCMYVCMYVFFCITHHHFMEELFLLKNSFGNFWSTLEIFEPSVSHNTQNNWLSGNKNLTFSFHCSVIYMAYPFMLTETNSHFKVGKGLKIKSKLFEELWNWRHQWNTLINIFQIRGKNHPFAEKTVSLWFQFLLFHSW